MRIKQRLFKNTASLVLAFVLAVTAFCAALPVHTAYASGLTLTASSGTTELIAAGQITITGTISNTTGEAIRDVRLQDITRVGSPVETGVGVAQIDAGGTYNYSVNVTLSDDRHLNIGNGQNYWRVTLQASGTSEGGQSLKSDPVNVIVTKAEAKSSMNLTLSASNGGTAVPENQVVTFTVLLENTGNTALSDISLTDPTLGTIASGISLGVGESKTVTAQHTMLQTITVRVTATGKSVIGDVPGMQISSVSNEVAVTLAEAGLTIDLTPSTLEVSRGDKVSFEGKLTNTGTMDITQITVTDIYGVEVLKDLTLKAGESKDFTYETTIENSDPYKVYVTGIGSDNAEITREYELKFNVKLSEDDVRVDMTVEADYPELEEPDTVIFTFEFYNDRTEPINLPMIVRQVDGPTLFSLVILSPGTTTQDYEMRIEESCTLRFELVATTEEGAELIAGAAACSITVADQPIKDNTQDANKGGNLTWLWILLGVVGFLLVAAGVVFFVLITQERKNKARRLASGGTDGYDQDGYGYDDGPYGGDDGDGGGYYDGYGYGDYDGQVDGYQDGYADDGSAYSGSYRSTNYTGSQFADSLFNDSQIGVTRRAMPQLTDGSDPDSRDNAQQDYTSQSFSSSASTIFGYDAPQDGYDLYGGTPRQEFTSGSYVPPQDAPTYQAPPADDDAFLDDLLGDDWADDEKKW